MNFFGRKNFSGRKENVEVVSGAVVIVIGLAVGNVAVANGRIPIVDEASGDTNKEGFLIKDKNTCRHKSSGISGLSINKSRNCRKPL